MLNATQFSDLIIKPALTDLLLLSDNAIHLLLFTCASESLGGTYLKQIHGPALGVYQMEPTTHNDLWTNYIMHKNDLKLILLHSFGIGHIPSEERLIYDLRYATAMSRIFYSRIKEPIPNYKDIDSLWGYYKLYYNTAKGAATKDQSINNYNKFITSWLL